MTNNCTICAAKEHSNKYKERKNISELREGLPRCAFFKVALYWAPYSHEVLYHGLLSLYVITLDRPTLHTKHQTDRRQHSSFLREGECNLDMLCDLPGSPSCRPDLAESRVKCHRPHIAADVCGQDRQRQEHHMSGCQQLHTAQRTAPCGLVHPSGVLWVHVILITCCFLVAVVVFSEIGLTQHDLWLDHTVHFMSISFFEYLIHATDIRIYVIIWTAVCSPYIAETFTVKKTSKLFCGKFCNPCLVCRVRWRMFKTLPVVLALGESLTVSITRSL